MPSRRQLLAGAGLAAAGLAGGSVAVGDRSESAALDWPMVRYDPAGTSYNPDASGPKDEPRVGWDGSLESSGGFAPDQPVVVGDTVYAGHEDLVAIDATSGDIRFSYGFDTYGQSTPAHASASIYRTDTLAISSPGGISGLNAGGGRALFGMRFGEQRWVGPGTAPRSSFFGAEQPAPPVAVDDTVYAPVPNTGDVVALEADNGRERWRRTIEYDDEYSTTLHRPAVRNGVVFVTGWPYQVRAFDAKTGRELWNEEHDDQTVLAPTATEDGVVVPFRDGVTMYDADGEQRWNRNLDGNAIEGAAAVAEGRVFVADGTESLHVLDLETGDEEWMVPFGREATPVVADGIVYVADGPRLIAFDAATGEQRFSHEAELYFSSPAVGDGVLYVVGDNRVLALEETA